MSYKIKSPLTISEGGTQVTTFTTAYAPVCAGTTATGALQVASTGISNSGYVLTSTGASSLPTFQASTSGSISITGDSGGALTSSSFTLTGGTSGAVFAGSGSTLTESFNYLSLPTTTATDGQIKINGTPAFHAYGNTNTFAGKSSGNFTMTANDCTGIGDHALPALTSGFSNTAVGTSASLLISSGAQNTSVGAGALGSETTGGLHTAVGYSALLSAAGSSNNTAVGWSALKNITTGAYNIAIGQSAGLNNTTSDNSNIYIMSQGNPGESHAIRIGFQTGSGISEQNKAYICGIDGVNVGSGTVKVVSMASDQLGTVNLTAGTGISVTPTANTITIANTASAITTINGNSGSATGSTVTFTGGTSGAVFTGSGSTITESFDYLALPTTTSTNGQIKINGNRFMHSYGGSNTFLGEETFNFTSNANECVGIGYRALKLSTDNPNTAVGAHSMSEGAVSGIGNTGLGHNTLKDLTSGTENTAIGHRALSSVSTEINNTVVGALSMTGSTGSSGNIAVGHNTMPQLTNGSGNIAIGNDAISQNGSECSDVIAIGTLAGLSYTTGESGNIVINNNGVGGESNVLRIGSGTGTGSQQLNAAYISGITGITVTGTAVLVASDDQLGVAVSSRRFKDNIQDMNVASSNILKLRPVTFNYNVGEDRSTQTGLIAEEVHELMPSLVVYGKDNLPQTVKYHDLPALLLNELQKAVKRIEQLEAKLNSK